LSDGGNAIGHDGGMHNGEAEVFEPMNESGTRTVRTGPDGNGV
jgi:hypothetical protein